MVEGISLVLPLAIIISTLSLKSLRKSFNSVPFFFPDRLALVVAKGLSYAANIFKAISLLGILTPIVFLLAVKRSEMPSFLFKMIVKLPGKYLFIKDFSILLM